MKWEIVGKYGRRCGPYSVGKIYLEGCTLYELWHLEKLIKTCNSFEECNEFAENHRKEHGR
jgi:hypothetical protein